MIAAIAIGETYYTDWEKCALPGWIEYCQHNGLGLVVFDQDLISPNKKEWKKATWQKMLIGETLIKTGINANNVCYLDSDILINPLAPNIFDSYDEKTIGLTSIRKNLPFPLDEVQRRLAFLRHAHYDNRYPLDSCLFMSCEQLYSYHGLAVQADEACMGLILFNVANHAELMRGWFYKYDKGVQSITNNGDQTHLNFEIQNYGKVQWLNYRFQAIWAYEMAWKYPFLYEAGRRDDVELIRDCIRASLHQNYFLHFAGSWHESQMWKHGGFFEGKTASKALHEYKVYRDTPVTGNPLGMIKP